MGPTPAPSSAAASGPEVKIHVVQSGETFTARVINTTSGAGLVGNFGQTNYATAKAGIAGLTQTLSLELHKLGVTVNCVCPGPIRTGMTELIPEEAKVKFARRRVPMRRYGDPEEVAQITLSLVLPAASFLTGAIIPVDGGIATTK